MTKDKSESKNTLYCSFCGKSQHEVKKLIAGPTVFICDECVELCMDIIKEENKASFNQKLEGIPTPTEINKVLNDYVIGQEKPPEGWCNIILALGRANLMPVAPAANIKDPIEAACPTHNVETFGLMYCIVS